MSKKKVIIFGSTGNTGLCALKYAVKLGYDVTAFVRDDKKLPDEFKSKVKIVVGDTSNLSDVNEAVKGQDAVVVALGTRNDLAPTTAMSDGTKNILASMNEFNVDKISVCISAFLFWERSKVPERFHALTEDHERMLTHLKNSNVTWIAVFPPHITEEVGSGSPVIAHDKGPGRTISKHDLGKFLVDSLDQPEHYNKICGITDPPKE